MTRVLITATPAHADGDLHLGHLSGPYLAADVFKRYCRLSGREACLVTGAGDNQSRVAARAEQLGLPPSAVAGRFDEAIRETLRRARIEPDVYVRPLHSSRHARCVAEFVKRLHARGHLVARETEAAWCGACRRFLFDAHLAGTCPRCGAYAGGGACESCGQLNRCTDLGDATCCRCGSPALRRPLERLHFPLALHAPRLAEHLSRVSMGSHLASLCDTMLAEGLPDVPVSNPSDWGIPVPVPGFAGQRLCAWFEMAPGLLSATAEMLAVTGRGGGWEDWWRSADCQVVQFLGHHDGYFHAILCAAALIAYDPGIRLPAALVASEPYRLDGLWFSTRRGHAIWGREALDHLPVDALRWYLCRDRPEAEPTNFRLHEFRDAATRRLVEAWEPWLQRLGRKLHAGYDGFVPEAAAPSAGQARFAAEVDGLVREATSFHQAESFSPRRVTAALDRLVDAAQAFGAAESHWRAGAVDRRRTAAALEVGAAATLAALASPIMPGFAARLWSELGFAAPLAAGDWPDRLVKVPCGQRLSGMSAPYFPGIDTGCDTLLMARAPRAAMAVA